MNKILISVNEFCDLHSIGKTRAYQMINNRDIDSVKIGRSRRIKTNSVEDWLKTLDV